jgi:cytochrome oxidase Cu insertion factor (SCO1/SenC/PrrC family)
VKTLFLKIRVGFCLLALAACVSNVWSAPHHESFAAVTTAPGYRVLEFALPAVGTYRRPKIGPAKDGLVVDSSGTQTSLHELMKGKVTLLSFMYTSCGDVNGCPLASHVLNKVMQRLLKDQRLSLEVQLLSLSFDRLNDNPDALRAYAGRFQAEEAKNWHFLTPTNDFELQKILKDYNQVVIRDMDEEGRPIGSMSHLLRVYLIDDSQNLREIYSVSFLHPDILIADILTVLESDPSN